MIGQTWIRFKVIIIVFIIVGWLLITLLLRWGDSNAKTTFDQSSHSPKPVDLAHHPKSPNPNSRGGAAIGTNSTDKYLLFYSHDGFSNQYFGLVGAMALAAETGRVLILPPISPHYTIKNGKDLRYNLRYRQRKECDQGLEYFKKDVEMVVGGVDIPAWSEIYDFNSYSQEFHGLKGPIFNENNSLISFMGFADFVEDIVMHDNNPLDEIAVLCSKFPSMKIKSRGHLKNYESSSQIVHVGSTFQLGYNILDSFEVPTPKPSRSVLEILQRIMTVSKKSILPRNYVGLHIRIQDGMIKELEKDATICASPTFRDVFNKRGESVEQLWNYFNDGRVIFVGTFVKTIKKCIVKMAMTKEMDHRREAGTNTSKHVLEEIENNFHNQIFMLKDILDKDQAAMDLVQNMQVEISTAMLALDQFIIGLAQDLFMVNMIQEHPSTFQRILRMIHKNKYLNDVSSQLLGISESRANMEVRNGTAAG